ncbi:PhzF family phenazine biosynthesis protein [Paenibacillus amylolyticus]|uniref:PhzF family phenazine biosynthesis protein n=1 Tax=Paenibacillus amylolyticus TaxID=1451 RepID=UPI00201D5EA0|nr:PhzF family phenazine biosynthesis protein [Paenibacillus amylolyticus]MCL6663907.1 PhzF family phenazine biosynthesis protein [Paenibacillus amylolyticus]
MMIRQIQVYHVDAFTHSAFEVNPAWGDPDASNITLTEMHKIANQLNLSEMAFLLPPPEPKTVLRVRYFTQLEKINFCTHATIIPFSPFKLKDLCLPENWGEAHD